jgi:hypothetical protein
VSSQSRASLKDVQNDPSIYPMRDVAGSGMAHGDKLTFNVDIVAEVKSAHS